MFPCFEIAVTASNKGPWRVFSQNIKIKKINHFISRKEQCRIRTDQYSLVISFCSGSRFVSILALENILFACVYLKEEGKVLHVCLSTRKEIGCISTHDAPVSNFLNGRQDNCFSQTSQAIRNKCSWLGTMTILSSSVEQGESWQLLGVFTYHLDGLWSLGRKPARLAKYPGLQMFDQRD